MNTRIIWGGDTPETVFDIASGEKGLYIDAINNELSRLEASVALFSAHFDDTADEGGRLNDTMLSNALWGIRGQIESLKKLIHLTGIHGAVIRDTIEEAVTDTEARQFDPATREGASQ